MNSLISPTALAKHLNISYTAVTEAIYKGRLKDSVTRLPNGRYQIDVAKAEAEWRTPECNTTTTTVPITRTLAQPAATPNTSIPAYSESRAIKEAYLARLAKLDYEERAGQLISVESVKAQAFAKGRLVRDSLLNLPDRISAEVAKLTDEHAVHQYLRTAITDTLQNLIDTDPNGYET